MLLSLGWNGTRVGFGIYTTIVREEIMYNTKGVSNDNEFPSLSLVLL